jgi:D-beta-D-heptose 7-phosphate kinase/D-beta-D-heptose 1-phosphate adenosyltransferase
MNSTYEDLLDRLSGCRVLIVGDVMLDEYQWGEAARLSPEAPVPVVEVRRRSFAPGGAANVAANVVGLGGTALLGGCIGPDGSAQRLKELLSDHDVNCDGLVTLPDRPTTTKTRLFAQGQQVVRTDCESRLPIPRDAEAALLAWIESYMPRVDGFVLSDYGKGVVSPRLAQHVVHVAKTTCRPLVVDPKGSSYDKYRGATVVKPNLHEVEEVLKREIRGDEEVATAGQVLIDQLEGTAVLITRGADGMTLCRHEELPAQTAATAQKVFDVTGAGDTVVAVLGLALAAGVGLAEAAALANQAASVVVSRRGTAAVTAQQLREVLPSEFCRRFGSEMNPLSTRSTPETPLQVGELWPVP